MSDDRYRDWDAAYVLGSLSPDERHEYEEHLAGCAECAASVTDLAGVPGMLSRLDVETAIAIRDLPDDAHLADAVHRDDVPRLARQVRRRRRRTIWISAAAVAAALVLGLGLGIAIPRLTAPPAMDYVLTAVGGSGVTAHLEAAPVGWGTKLAWSCDYGATGGTAYAGDVYALVVTTREGRVQTVATWGAEGERAGNLTASTSIPVSDISTIDIRVADRSGPLSRVRL